MSSGELPSALADSRARFGFVTRFAVLLGLAAGLAGAVVAPPAPVAALAVALAALGTALAWRKPRLTLVALTALAAVAGSVAGGLRLDALDSRALRGTPGQPLEATGFVLQPPRPAPDGGSRFPVELPRGRIEVHSGAEPHVSVGRRIYLSGSLREPDDFDRERLRGDGIALVLEAGKAEPVPGGRGGLAGALDAIRRRGEAALGRGSGRAASSLLRGFVLGEDEAIPEPVRDEFKRSGLAHILAVSGQNVVLLALLATPLLALLGVPLRLRYVALIGLIAIYVPVAGGGPSIVRAGAMGVAGLVAAMASRPSSRYYALTLAAAFTLAIDPRFVSDVGWQLSFAAVLGIVLLARPLAQALAPASRRQGPLRSALTEGAALTIAATVATAPLIALHFETVSLTTLPANLLAAPAVAPAMWLGMASAAIGQIPGAPVEPLTFAGGLCAGFIAWVAHLFGGIGAQRQVSAPGPAALTAIYASAAVVSAVGIGYLRRRGAARPSLAALARRGAKRKSVLLLALALAAVGSVSLLLSTGSESPAKQPPLRINFLDVGQGDSILLRTRDGRSLLVDTGPPGSPAAARLRELGVERLSALALTHDESDHAGGLAEVLTEVGSRRLVVSRGGVPEACSALACPPATSVARGDVLRMGRLRIRVLWPPPTLLEQRGGDRNLRSLVLLVGYRRFRLLLTGDAEQGFAPVQPGNVDVLKVAHHGSDDPGLDELLDRATPRLAVISVGAGNSYGHPTAATLHELGEHGVRVERTDTDGEIELDVFAGSWSVG